MPVKVRSEAQLPVVLNALKCAGEALGQPYKVHVESTSTSYFSEEDFKAMAPVERVVGVTNEAQFERIDEAQLGTEWEWEKTPK